MTSFAAWGPSIGPALARWSGHDTLLLVWAGSAIAGIVVLISLLKVHPFIALIVGSGWVSLNAGLSGDRAIAAFEKGAGETLGGVGMVVALGAMLGRLFADSGGADRVVTLILARTGARYLPWAVAAAAMLIGIPMFFEVGLVLLMPMILLAARRAGGSSLRIGIPALAGLSALHGLIPPHPGPLMAITALDADVGPTLFAGLLIAIPTVTVAGPLFGSWVGRSMSPSPPAFVLRPPRGPADDAGPRASVVLLTLLLPVALMLLRAVSALVAKGPPIAVIAFVGHPIVAMLIAVIVATFTLRYARGVSLSGVSVRLGESLAPVAAILVILGAGGGFKQTLIESGVGEAIGRAAQNAHVPPLFLGWFIAVAIRVATGSATLATITASGILAPIIPMMPHVSRPLLVLAIGSGSLFFSHVNDAGFWLVKEYFGMTVGQTLKSWSVMETLISVIAMACVFALSRIS